MSTTSDAAFDRRGGDERGASPNGRLQTYAFRAARPDGAIVLGTVEAVGRELASRTVAERGLFPLEIELDDSAPRFDGPRGARLPARDLALGLRALSTLIEAGLPMARVLAAFDELAPASWQPALPHVSSAVREGRGLATALATSGVEIPPFVIGMLRAGEAGGSLALAVLRAAELTERNASTRAALRSALAYPLVLAAAGGASVVLLVGVVLPRFSAILGDLGMPLPATTRAVLSAATTIRTLAIPGVVAILAAGVAWRAWTASVEGIRQWHAMLLQLPIVGSIRRSAATARMTGALAALLESGVPAAAALTHAARATGDAALETRVRKAREHIVAGGRIAAALQATDATTPIVVRLVRAGEESGRLAAMLAHASRLESERAERGVKTLVALIEPSLILAFGGLVALVAAALLQAVYAVRPAV